MEHPHGPHDHHHGHGHGHHSHNHSHSHAPASFNKVFALGIALNLLFVAVEVIYGYTSSSLALMSDAGHNLSDVLGLVLAWFGLWLSKRSPSAKFTYGLRGASILAAVANAVLLLVAIVGIVYEAVLRFNNPEPIQGSVVMTVAAMGIAINGFTAFLFVKGSKEDLNVRGAFLHMLADALVSAGVVVAGFLIVQTGLTWIDPVVSLVIALVIFLSTWKLLKASVSLALGGVPEGIDTEKVRSFILSHPYISSVHDLHVWGLSTSQNALTAHVIAKKCPLENGELFELQHGIQDKFNIKHVTIQVEYDGPSGSDCVLKADPCC